MTVFQDFVDFFVCLVFTVGGQRTLSMQLTPLITKSEEYYLHTQSLYATDTLETDDNSEHEFVVTSVTGALVVGSMFIVCIRWHEYSSNT
jgi:hypothetical protein